MRTENISAIARSFLLGAALFGLETGVAFSAETGNVTIAAVSPSASATSHHPSEAVLLTRQAEQLRKQGRITEAEPLYLQALSIWEETLGKEHPAAAMGLSNLAEFRKSQRRFNEAEALHNRALAIWENALGKGHPSVGFSLHKLALLYEEQDKLADALPTCQRALLILQDMLPAGHPAADEVQQDCSRMSQKNGETVTAR